MLMDISFALVWFSFFFFTWGFLSGRGEEERGEKKEV